jgi:alkylhydroperoxidase family enzyme
MAGVGEIMYRIDMPPGANPISHVVEGFGNPALVAARQQFIAAVYQAPGTRLAPREREAIRVPIAKNIGCHTCLAARFWRDVPGFSEEIEEVFYQSIINYDLTWEGFTSRERFLVEFSDRFEKEHLLMNGDDELWERAGALFSEEELGDVFIIMGALGGVGHTLNVVGVGSVCEVPGVAGIARLAQGLSAGAFEEESIRV